MKHFQYINEISSENAKKIIRVYEDDELLIILPLSKRFVAVFSDPSWCSSQDAGINYHTEKGGLFFRFLFKDGKKLRMTWYPTLKFTWSDQEQSHIAGNGNPFIDIDEEDKRVWPEFFEMFNRISMQAMQAVFFTADEYFKKINQCYTKVDTVDSIKLELRQHRAKLKRNAMLINNYQNTLKTSIHKEERRYSTEAVEDLEDQSKDIRNRIKELEEELRMKK